MSTDRRTFLQSAASAGAFLVGCTKGDPGDPAGMGGAGSGTGGLGGRSGGSGGSNEVGSGGSENPPGSGGAGTEPPVDCPDPFEGGQYVDDAAFVGEDGARPLNTLMREGWDARLRTDLTMVDQDNLIVPNEYFFIRTRYPDQLVPPASWEIAVNGLATPTSLVLSDLLPMTRDMGASWLECSGNGSGSAFGLLSAARWGGIPIDDVLSRIEIDSSATRVLISGFDGHSVPSAGGHSTPGASWIFTFDELRNAGAFLATEMNGVPLPPDHGEPVRLIVPGWYGCTNIKWVNEIVLVDDNEPATSQMIEFAGRTHQRGTPTMARDYIPATGDQAAMPVRIEKWRVDGTIKYRVVGIMWGGYELTNNLQIRYGDGGQWRSVEICPMHSTNRTWTVWTHEWTPESTGDYAIRCRINDVGIRTRRLDTGFYERVVRVDEV